MSSLCKTCLRSASVIFSASRSATSDVSAPFTDSSAVLPSEESDQVCVSTATFSTSGTSAGAGRGASAHPAPDMIVGTRKPRTSYRQLPSFFLLCINLWGTFWDPRDFSKMPTKQCVITAYVCNCYRIQAHLKPYAVEHVSAPWHYLRTVCHLHTLLHFRKQHQW